MDPVRFFTGPCRVLGRAGRPAGQPTAVVTTECLGEAEGRDGVHMVQALQVGADAPVTRDWHMRRIGPGRYEATANDMVGVAAGEAAGRAFHWQWTLALQPGNPVKNVTMDQWWYLLDDRLRC